MEKASYNLNRLRDEFISHISGARIDDELCDYIISYLNLNDDFDNQTDNSDEDELTTLALNYIDPEDQFDRDETIRKLNLAIKNYILKYSRHSK